MKYNIAASDIKSLIHSVRGKAVMLDRDLAILYGVQTRVLNQAVKRNAQRFPADFMFPLTRPEIERISQIVTSLKFSKNVNAFTEQGIAMLSSVLKSEKAIQINIHIMRAFVLIKRLGLTIHDLRRSIAQMEKKYDQQFRVVFDALRQLINPPSDLKKNRRMGFVADSEEA